MRALVLLALLPVPALACPNDSQIFACQIGQKTLEICHWKGSLTYLFGQPDDPELTMSEPLQTIDFRPWPGAGRYIWETLTFRNDGYSYEIWTSVERGADATGDLAAAVTVFEGEAEIARLDCDPGTPTNSLDVVFGLKQSIGQCWDHETQTWTAACN